MRKVIFGLMLTVSGCTASQETPFATNASALASRATTIVNGEARGEVELFVKTNHPALIQDIRQGGGATLTQAYDTANVPIENRPLQTLRLQSERPLYEANLNALVAALMVGSA